MLQKKSKDLFKNLDPTIKKVLVWLFIGYVCILLIDKLDQSISKISANLNPFQSKEEKEFEDKQKEDNTKAVNTIAKNYGVSQSKTIELENKAVNFAKALGTNQGWYNPASYFEDEDKAWNILLSLNNGTEYLIFRKYYATHTNRIAYDDINEFLPSDEYKRSKLKFSVIR